MAETQVHVHVKPNEEHYGTSKYIKVNRITGEELPLPVQSGTLKYTGGSQSPTWENYDRDKMTVSGISGVNAGTYTAKFVLKKGFYWEDGTITSKEINWVIEKADGYVNLTNRITSIMQGATDDNIIYIASASSPISVSSSDTSIINPVLENNNKVICNYVADGSVTISITATETDNYKECTETLEIRATHGLYYGIKYMSSKGWVYTRTGEAAGLAEPVPYNYDQGTGGSSPFDNIYPWSDTEIVTRRGIGKVLKVPKFYCRFVSNPGEFEIQIAEEQIPGFQVSPAHADRNDGVGERDYVYYTIYPMNKSNNYQSKPEGQIDNFQLDPVEEIRIIINNMDNKAFIQDYSMYLTMRMLYMVEMGDMYNNPKIPSYSYYPTIGSSDIIPYHTGYAASKQVDKYRGIECFKNTFNGGELIDGIFQCGASSATPGDVYATITPNSDDYIKIGNYLSRYEKSIKAYVNDIYQYSITGNEVLPIIPSSITWYTTTYKGRIIGIGSLLGEASSGSTFSGEKFRIRSNNAYGYGLGIMGYTYDNLGRVRCMVLPDNNEQQKQEGYINCEDEVDVISYNDWIEIPVTASGDWSISKSYQDASDLYNCSINIIKDNNKLKIKGISGIGHYYIELYASENDNYYDATKIINVYVDLDGIRFDPSYNRTVTMNVGDSTTVSFADSWKGSKVYSISWHDPSSTKNTASVNNGSIIINAYEAGTFHLSLKNTNSDQTDMLTVIVTGKPESHIYFSPDHITMNKNSKANIIIQGYDSDTTRYTYLPKGGIEQGNAVISWNEYNLNDGSPTIVLGSSYYTGVFTIQVEKRYKASKALIETATLTVTVV